MPRSPSPPYRSRGYDYPRRGGRGGDSYRYRDSPDRDWSERDWGRDRGFSGYGGRDRYRDDRNRRRSWSRSRSRSRSRDRPRGGGRRDEVDDRRYIPDERRYSPAKSSRSITPEEGQITSPLRQRSPRRRTPPAPALPPPPRRRDSPPPRSEREWSAERDRDWRDRRRPPAPGPPSRDHRDSPSPRRVSRDLSPASSRSRSSRFPSPEKRRPYLPSPRRLRSPSRAESSDLDRDRHRPSGPTALTPTPSAADTPARRPVPVAVPFGGPKPGFRQPPSGPRSERFPPTGPAIPSGPRALQTQVPPQPPQPPIQSQQQPQVPPPAPAPAATAPNPYVSRPGSYDSAASGPGSHRLSWAERKGSQTPGGRVEEDFKPHVENQDVDMQHTAAASIPRQAQPTEADLAELKVKEDDARIAAELPELKISFAPAPWEIELDQHFKHMETLEQNTMRAQSAQRIATAMWSDADADRVAAMERRRIAEEQLVKASSLGVGVGLL